MIATGYISFLSFFYSVVVIILFTAAAVQFYILQQKIEELGKAVQKKKIKLFKKSY